MSSLSLDPNTWYRIFEREDQEGALSAGACGTQVGGNASFTSWQTQSNQLWQAFSVNNTHFFLRNSETCFLSGLPRPNGSLIGDGHSAATRLFDDTLPDYLWFTERWQDDNGYLLRSVRFEAVLQRYWDGAAAGQAILNRTLSPAPTAGERIDFIPIRQINQPAFSSVSGRFTTTTLGTPATTSATTATTTTASTASATDNSGAGGGGSGGGLSSGAQAAIGASIGGVAVLVAVILAYFLIVRKKRQAPNAPSYPELNTQEHLSLQPVGLDGSKSVWCADCATAHPLSYNAAGSGYVACPQNSISVTYAQHSEADTAPAQGLSPGSHQWSSSVISEMPAEVSPNLSNRNKTSGDEGH